MALGAFDEKANCGVSTGSQAPGKDGSCVEKKSHTGSHDVIPMTVLRSFGGGTGVALLLINRAATCAACNGSMIQRASMKRQTKTVKSSW